MDLMQEYIDGYRDGFRGDLPTASGNRTHCYQHGFAVGQSDRRGEPAFGGTDAAHRKATEAAIKDMTT